MSSTSITNNNAVRLGAAAIIGTVIIYLLWSTTASSNNSNNKPKDRSASSSKTTTTTTTTTTTISSEKKKAAKEAKEAHEHTAEKQEDKKVIDEVPVVKAEKITEQKEHEEKPREKEPVKAAEVVPEPLQEPVAAPVVEPMVEKVEEEEEQQTAQEPEIEEEEEEEIAVEEFDEEHEVELVFERQMPATAVLIPPTVQEIKEVIEEIIEEAAPVAVEVPEQTEVEPEQVHELQKEEEAQVDTPTTLVGDQLEHTKEAEEAAQVVVEAPRKPESWSAATEDKVQTLQEVSRVAQHSELNAKAAEFKPSWLPSVTAAPAKPNGTAVNGAPAAEPVKMKSRCRFWPNCTNKSCKFTHPSTYCRDPDNCSFGDRCNFIHPNDMTARPPRDKGDKKGVRRQTAVGDRKGRPKSSDSSVNMVAASPVDAWSK